MSRKLTPEQRFTEILEPLIRRLIWALEEASLDATHVGVRIPIKQVEAIIAGYNEFLE